MPIPVAAQSKAVLLLGLRVEIQPEACDVCLLQVSCVVR